MTVLLSFLLIIDYLSKQLSADTFSYLHNNLFKVNIFCPLYGLGWVSLHLQNSCLVYCFVLPKDSRVKVTSDIEFCEFIGL